MNKSVKIWLITAASLILTGALIFTVVMALLKWDFTKLSTVKYQTKNYEISESFENISIDTDTANINFVLTKNAKASVKCYEQKTENHNVFVENKTLNIKLKENKKWYDNIGINIGTSKITVYLPQGEYGKLLVKDSTGDIKIKSIPVSAIDLSLSTGDVSVSDVKCIGDIKIKVSTGEIFVSNTECKNLISGGSTGDIVLKNLKSNEKLSIKRSTGDVDFYSCDADEISVKTSTGDVRGSVLSPKVFIAHSDTGDIDVPETTVGGKCKITTDTGDIKISIKK